MSDWQINAKCTVCHKEPTPNEGVVGWAQSHANAEKHIVRISYHNEEFVHPD